MPVELTSIFLKSAGEKNDGNLHISLVTGLNSEIPHKINLSVTQLSVISLNLFNQTNKRVKVQ